MTTLDEALAFALAYTEAEEGLARAYAADPLDPQAASAARDRFHTLYAPGTMSEWANQAPGAGTPEQRALQRQRIQRRPVFRLERFETADHGEQIAATLGEARVNDFGVLPYQRLLWLDPSERGGLQVLTVSRVCPSCGASGLARGKGPDPCRECGGGGWKHSDGGRWNGPALRPVRRTEDLRVQPPTAPRSKVAWER